MNADVKPHIRDFFHEPDNTVSYLVADPQTRQAAVIDPVLDFDAASGEVHWSSAEKILDCAVHEGWSIVRVLETHAHADHLSAAPWFREKTGARIGIGEHISKVQKIFKPVFNLSILSGKGEEFDDLFVDGQCFTVGNLSFKVMHTPGHTPACICYCVADAVFTGDTLFMPDYGTARADFPGGNAAMLYQSIQKILSLPDETRLFHCHDYKAPGRDKFIWQSTVAEQKKYNIHVHEGIDEKAFVAMRERRDATLAAPNLLLPSIQVNIQAGELPQPDEAGVRYLRLPLNFKN